MQRHSIYFTNWNSRKVLELWSNNQFHTLMLCFHQNSTFKSPTKEIKHMKVSHVFIGLFNSRPSFTRSRVKFRKVVTWPLGIHHHVSGHFVVTNNKNETKNKPKEFACFWNWKVPICTSNKYPLYTFCNTTRRCHISLPHQTQEIKYW